MTDEEIQRRSTTQVRNRRRVLNLRQIDIAQRAGVNVKTVRRLEQGKMIETFTLNRILHVVGLELTIQEIREMKV